MDLPVALVTGGGSATMLIKIGDAVCAMVLGSVVVFVISMVCSSCLSPACIQVADVACQGPCTYKMTRQSDEPANWLPGRFEYKEAWFRADQTERERNRPGHSTRVHRACLVTLGYAIGVMQVSVMAVLYGACSISFKVSWSSWSSGSTDLSLEL